MSQDVTLPVYVYDEETTLTSLLAAFLAANPDRLEETAKIIGVKADTFGQWVDGIWTEGLRTRYFHAFVRATGIDLDRLMVIEAKRRILERDPGARAYVTYERFQSRADLVLEVQRIKALPIYDGVRMIAWQIDVSDRSVHNWSNGRELPANDNLDACVLGLSRGLIETGTRNDLAMRVAVRRVCGQEPEECLGLSTFQELVNAVFPPSLRARGDTIASQQTGISRGTTADLLRWKPTDETTFPYATMFNLVRIHVRARWDDPAKERFERVIAEFLDKDNTSYAVRETVFPRAGAKPESSVPPPVLPDARPAPPPRAEPPRVAATPPPPPRAPPADRPAATLDGGILRLVTHLRTQLLQVGVEFPDVVRRLPLIPGLVIGETLHNVRWCLTGTNVPEVGDWDPSDNEIELIAEAVALLRRSILIILGLPMPVRRRVIKRLARELDELFLAFDHAGVEDLVGFAEQIGLQRQHADLVRKGK